MSAILTTPLPLALLEKKMMLVTSTLSVVMKQLKIMRACGQSYKTYLA
jgi:hypothetical protein